MNFLKKFSKSKDFWPVTIVLFLGFLAGRALLFPGYFNMHDDLQMMRQLEIEKCFKDLQIPCRWVPDMGYGYGFPLFNYYPPLPYLVGQGIRVLGFTFVDTIKITFFLSFVLSGITMYLLAREFWGRLGGMVSSGFYIWAPYHAVDVYVRGAMNEAWALVWFPLILWSSYKLLLSSALAPLHIALKRKHLNVRRSDTAYGLERAHSTVPIALISLSSKWIIVLSLSWTALLLSHNIMVMIFTPVFGLWCVFWLWRGGTLKRIPLLVISVIWSFGLAAFFSLPVILEQKLVHIDTLTKGYYEYVAHFANLNQLFLSRFWGYGASVWGEGDKMSFQIGHVHWMLSLIIGGLLIIKLLRKEKIPTNLLFVIYFLLFSGWLASFMSHVRSTPIWLTLPILSIVQFPWRFLTIVILSFSLIAGALVVLINQRSWVVGGIVGILLIGVVLFNYRYFRPERMGPLTDQEKFSGAAWELQQTAGIYDYLPRGAKIAPNGPRTTAVEVLSGEADIKDVREGTNWIKFKADVGEENATLRVNIFYFPNWRIFANGYEIPMTTNVIGEKGELLAPANDDLGRMDIILPKGSYEVYGKLYSTTIRTIANIISLVSWVALFIIIWKKKLLPGRIRA